MKTIKVDTLLALTLLSIEEYEAEKESIPPVEGWWWLRSPGFNSVCAAYVGSDGSVSDIGYVRYDKIGVRPVFRVNPETLSPPIGEKASVEEFICTRISEDLLLCDNIICEMPFRKDGAADANKYEASDIKKYLDRFFVNIVARQTVKEAVGEMSYAFNTLKDCMKAHMPDYEATVAKAYDNFKRSEEKAQAFLDKFM